MTRKHHVCFQGVPNETDVIEVQLTPRDTYTDGDRVTGQVILHHHHDYRFNEIQLHFYGKTTNGLYVKKHYDDSKSHSQHIFEDTILFHKQKDLHYGPELIQGLRAWRFAFDFPSKVEAVSNSKPFNKDPNFEDTPSHRLPPTSANRHHAGKLTARHVEYYVEVLAQDPYALKQGIFQHRVDVQYVPSRSLLVPPLKYFVQTQGFCRISRRLGQCRAALHSHRKGKVFFFFRLRLAVPKQKYRSGPFPLKVAIEHDMAHSSIIEAPLLHIHAHKVKLTAVTDYRDARFPHPKREKRTIGRVCGKGGEMKLNRLFRKDLTPTFKTYDLAHHYLLAIELTLKCAGKKYKIRPHMTELVVLSPIYRPLLVQPAAVPLPPSPLLDPLTRDVLGT